MLRLIHSKGEPRYTVWVKDKEGKWHGAGQVYEPNENNDLLSEINSGRYFNSNYDKCDFVDIQYLPNDGEHNPNLY